MRCSQCSAALPISSASSRCAASSGASPSTSSRPAGISRKSGSSIDLARLAHEEEVGAVVGDDADRALVADDLALDLLAVGIAVALDAQGDDAALVDGAAPEGLEAAVGGGHRRSVAYGAGRRVHAAAALGAHVRVERRRDRGEPVGLGVGGEHPQVLELGEAVDAWPACRVTTSSGSRSPSSSPASWQRCTASRSSPSAARDTARPSSERGRRRWPTKRCMARA